MNKVDFSYSNLKHCTLQGDLYTLKDLKLFRTNLQYALLDHRYFDDNVLNTSYIHKARINGTLRHDRNLLLPLASTCEKRIPDKWKVESGDENVVVSHNYTGSCRFSLKTSIKTIILTQYVNLHGIWEREMWPISYGIMSVSMSHDVVVELSGIDQNGKVINSILMSKS